MKKTAYICCLTLLFCSCMSIKNITYNDYKHSIDLVFPENVYVPAIELKINNKNFFAKYNTWHKNNIIGKKILNEIGVENIEGKTDITISQIILSNGIILSNIKFDIVELDNDIVQVIFGLSALNEYNVLISYKQNKIFLYNSEELPNYLNSWVKVEVVYPEIGLFINGGVKGSAKTYLLCLGNNSSMYGGIFNRHYNIVLDINIPITTLFTDTIIIGGRKYGNLYFFNWLSKEDKEFFNLNNAKIILGYDFFKKYDIFIDVNNMKLYIENP
jgi:hypothetical protein